MEKNIFNKKVITEARRKSGTRQFWLGFNKNIGKQMLTTAIVHGVREVGILTNN